VFVSGDVQDNAIIIAVAVGAPCLVIVVIVIAVLIYCYKVKTNRYKADLRFQQRSSAVAEQPHVVSSLPSRLQNVYIYDLHQIDQGYLACENRQHCTCTLMCTFLSYLLLIFI